MQTNNKEDRGKGGDFEYDKTRNISRIVYMQFLYNKGVKQITTTFEFC